MKTRKKKFKNFMYCVFFVDFDNLIYLSSLLLDSPKKKKKKDEQPPHKKNLVTQTEL